MNMQMRHERADGPTFDINCICFIDFETKSPTDIRQSGTFRYAVEAYAIILTYAIGNGPVKVISDWDGLDMTDLPTDLLAFHAKAMNGTGWYAAWNTSFDRAVWNYSALAFPEMLPHMAIDIMAQAVASGLPADLAGAARASEANRKLASGKELIKLFCLADSHGTPETHSFEWREFQSYAIQDVEAMRSVFKGTRQLPLAEWREYWAMEAINQRGIGIDVHFVRSAAALAQQDRKFSSIELSKLTDGVVTSPDQVQRLINWLLPRLPPEQQAVLMSVEEEKDDEGEVTKDAEHTLRRRQVERLIAWAQDRPAVEDVLRVLQIRLYGGSKTPAKFSKMLQQEVDGVLYGQYVFNGAAQTGRASSKGVQIHNLARDTLKDEPEVINRIIEGCEYQDIATLIDDTPVARKLSLLIRPAFVPRSGKVFVWSDWSQIEARILPWLADHLPGTKARLEIFRAVDADPSVPDIYTRTAAAISRIPIEQVTKPIRQRGKVAELALGYCGGVGALQNMAAGYGMHLDNAEAKLIVDRWRDANAWAIRFSREIWDAVCFCHNHPGVPFNVNRLTLIFLHGYLGGTLLIRLPSGRYLSYRSLRWEPLPVKDSKGVTIDERMELTFARARNRLKLWPGMFVENVTQAAAADVLRGTLRRLGYLKLDVPLDVRLHTHDEILLEADEADVEQTKRELRRVMQWGFDWSKDLPLMSEETVAHYYTKDDGAYE